MAFGRSVRVEGRFYVLSFAPNDQILADLKRTVPGRRYIKAHRHWVAPASSRDAVTAFAARHGFTIGAATPSVRWERRTGEFVVHPPVAAIDTLKASFPVRTWDGNLSSWRIPGYLVRRIRPWAESIPEMVVHRDVFDAPDYDPGIIPVVVEDAGDDVAVTLTYDVRAIAAILRDLPGVRWDGGRRWLIPPDAVAKFLDSLGEHDIGDVARDLITNTQAIIERVARSRAIDAPLVLPDRWTAPLREYQRGGCAYLIDVAAGRGILGDDPGLGKTRQAIEVLEHFGAYPAVVAIPYNAKGAWRRELHTCVPWRSVVTLEGRTPTPFPLFRPDVILITYDNLYGWVDHLVDHVRPVAVVADEAHRLKEDKARRTQAALRLAGARTGDDDPLPAHLPDVALCLTGTPSRNTRGDLYNLLAFCRRTADLGYTSKADLKRDRDSARRIRAVCMVRREKADVLTELPPRQHVPVPCDLDPAVMVEYSHAEHDLLAYIAKRAAERAAEMGDPDPKSAAVKARMRAAAAEHLVAVNVLKRLAGKAKVAAAIDWVRTFLAERPDEKVLVFAHHHDIIDPIAAAFDAPTITGKIKTTERDAVEERFQTDPTCRVLVLQTQAGGEAITLTAATNVLFVEFEWVPGDHDQAIDRCHGRVNDPHGAVGWYLYADGTIEEDIVDLLDDKRAENEDAIDGDRMRDEHGRHIESARRTSVLGDLVARLVDRTP